MEKQHSTILQKSEELGYNTTRYTISVYVDFWSKFMPAPYDWNSSGTDLLISGWTEAEVATKNSWEL